MELWGGVLKPCAMNLDRLNSYMLARRISVKLGLLGGERLHGESVSVYIGLGMSVLGHRLGENKVLPPNIRWTY